jgi:hypothetical protein
MPTFWRQRRVLPGNASRLGARGPPASAAAPRRPVRQGRDEQEKGWQPVEAANLPPRFQCSPLAWDDGLGGLVFYGGEARHGGPQFQTTWLLRVSAAADAKPESFEFVKI